MDYVVIIDTCHFDVSPPPALVGPNPFSAMVLAAFGMLVMLRKSKTRRKK